MNNQYEIVGYIKENPVAVISTVDRNNVPCGSAVYVCAMSAEQLYFVTKIETEKYQNILVNPEVAITIVNSSENSSLQANGKAEIIDDPGVIELVMSKMATIYSHGADWLPPIAKIRAGAYQVVGVKARHIKLAHYKDAHAGDKKIFKES